MKRSEAIKIATEYVQRHGEPQPRIQHVERWGTDEWSVAFHGDTELDNNTIVTVDARTRQARWSYIVLGEDGERAV